MAVSCIVVQNRDELPVNTTKYTRLSIIKKTIQSFPFAVPIFAPLVHQIPDVFALLTITYQGKMRKFSYTQILF